MQPLRIQRGLTIPAHELSFVATRSTGAGGQNVNKVASKVELCFDFQSSTALPDEVKARLKKLGARYLNAEGGLRISSQKTRTQSRNLQDARNKLASLVLRALALPKQRIPTQPSRVAVEQRLAQKRKISQRKQSRKSEELT